MFLTSAQQCDTHGTQCRDCGKLVDACNRPGLPMRPCHHLTIDSTMVLAAFDQANEVTRRFHAAHAQDHEETNAVSSDKEGTVLEGGDGEGHDARGAHEKGKGPASPMVRRGQKTHPQSTKAQE